MTVAAEAEIEPCSRNTPPCAARFDATVDTPRCCIEQHVAILRTVGPMLDAAGVRWWIDYGMLLGWMVSGGWYWNDKDIDISTLDSDRRKLRSLLRPIERSARGRSAIYRHPNRSFPWKYSDYVKVIDRPNRAVLDITVWLTRPDGLLDRFSYAGGDRYKGRVTPLSWIFPTTRVMWEGIDVPLPAEPEKLVAYRYGDGWRDLPAARHDGVER